MTSSTELVDMGRKFAIGDVVQLKSGGAKMTVDGFTDRNEIRLVWTDRNDKPCRLVVDPAILVSAQAES